MKRELIPYYVSRAVMAAAFGLLFVVLNGSTWWLGLVIGLLVYAGFIWYAHSGHYLIDTSKPLTPLRRDERGRDIRNRALILAVVVGGLAFALFSVAGLLIALPPQLGSIALLLAFVTYFAASEWMFARR
jgi:ABC-type antimicrobial peptide transport system permease subunit